MWKIIGWTVGIVSGLFLALVLSGWAYYESLDLEAEPQGNPAATAADLDFVREGVREQRGRVLAVLSSTARFDQDRRQGGYELTEISRAYWVFKANGYEVDLASPLGGTPPQTLDDGLVDADYAFLNDPAVRSKLADTIPLAEVDPSEYDAVYFVGGKGAMFDFPGNADIARIVRDIAPRGVIGAVCHGPAALLDITLADGRPLLQGRRVTGFSNAEELLMIKEARTVFPFMLQESLAQQSAGFVEGPMYLDNTVVDGRLVTGQNPWSTWTVAEAMVRALGHEPVARRTTTEEVSVQLLATYHAQGLEKAVERKLAGPQADKLLLLMHAVIAAMQGKLSEAWELQRLARI
tara:strand:- start:5848 stop:6897 length:1050 start_codon:yes stop_codon:yes gene_type:complete